MPGLSAFLSERTVTIDSYSGAIFDVRDLNTRRTAGETFLDRQWLLHSGQGFSSRLPQWTGFSGHLRNWLSDVVTESVIEDLSMCCRSDR